MYFPPPPPPLFPILTHSNKQTYIRTFPLPQSPLPLPTPHVLPGPVISLSSCMIYAFYKQSKTAIHEPIDLSFLSLCTPSCKHCARRRHSPRRLCKRIYDDGPAMTGLPVAVFALPGQCSFGPFIGVFVYCLLVGWLLNVPAKRWRAPVTNLFYNSTCFLTQIPPRWPSGKCDRLGSGRSRVRFPLATGFFLVESYQ